MRTITISIHLTGASAGFPREGDNLNIIRPKWGWGLPKFVHVDPPLLIKIAIVHTIACVNFPWEKPSGFPEDDEEDDGAPDKLIYYKRTTGATKCRITTSVWCAKHSQTYHRSYQDQ